MKTGIKMRVTPDQREEVVRIAKEHGLKMGVSFNINGDFVVLYPKNDEDCFAIFDTEALDFGAHPYEEVDPELFIRTNGTCEEWKPEPGEMIMVWNVNGENAEKREFITMTKDGKGFLCHNLLGTSSGTWDNAKPAPKDWTDLVSEDNPAICWVWHHESESYMGVALIVGIDTDSFKKYKDSFGAHWAKAQFIMWAKDAR